MLQLFKKIKMVAALGLIICLFLPLSQCSQTPSAITKSKEVVVYDRYVVAHSTEPSLKNYIPALFFVLPAVMALLNFRVRRERLFYEVAEIAVALLPLSVVFFHAMTGRLVFGGYLALVLAGAYLVLCVAESWQIIKQRSKAG